jgi:hypothetical protein
MRNLTGSELFLLGFIGGGVFYGYLTIYLEKVKAKTWLKAEMYLNEETVVYGYAPEEPPEDRKGV